MANGIITHDVIIFIYGVIAVIVFIGIIAAVRDLLKPKSPYQGAPAEPGRSRADLSNEIDDLNARLAKKHRQVERLLEYACRARGNVRRFIVSIPLSEARKHAEVLLAAHALYRECQWLSGDTTAESTSSASSDGMSPAMKFAASADAFVQKVRKDPTAGPAVRVALDAYDAASDAAIQELEAERRKAI